MSTFLKFSLSCIVFLVAGCSTTSQIGSAPLVYTDQLDQVYQSYVHKQTGSRYSGAALALNPKTGKMTSALARYGANATAAARKSALNRCGEGCYLFAIDKKIVWKGLDTKVIFTTDPSTNIIGYDEYIIKQYGPNNFKLTPTQKTDFQDYLLLVLIKEPDENYAFAVSTLGYSGSGKRYDSLAAKLDAVRECEIRSIGLPCYIYALNDRVVVKE